MTESEPPEGSVPSGTPTAAHAPKKRRRIWIWILVAAPVVGLLALGGFVLLVGKLFFWSGKAQPIEETDRAVLVDAGRVAEWFDDLEIVASAEAWSKVRYIDGSYDIEYEYSDEANEDAPYVSCTVTVERNVSDAKIGYVSIWKLTEMSFQFGLGGADTKVEERNDVFSWGDESRFGLLVIEDDPFGNLFVARKGEKIFYLLLAGVYFDDTASFTGLVDSSLDELVRYEP